MVLQQKSQTQYYFKEKYIEILNYDKKFAYDVNLRKNNINDQDCKNEKSRKNIEQLIEENYLKIIHRKY